MQSTLLLALALLSASLTPASPIRTVSDFKPDAGYFEQLDPGAVAASRRARDRGEPVDDDGVPVAAYVPGQIVLRLAPGAEALAAQVHDALGSRVERRIPEGRFERVTLPPELSVVAALRLYATLPFVEHAERNWRRALCEIPNDPEFNVPPVGQWAVRRIGCERAWDITKGSSSVIIAIVDSGVQSFHDDLGGALVSGWNTIADNGDTSDADGHGTAMALVAAANDNNHLGTVGVAPRCRVMPIKAINPTSGGSFEAADGVRWAADHGAHVINMSYGSTSYSLVEDWAVQHAFIDKNCVCVASAGNDGTSEKNYPAALALVLSVGGTDVFSEKRWQYSNYGPIWVDVAAPANLVAYTIEESDNHLSVVYGQGTSEACALVSGAAALLFSHLGTSTGNFTIVYRLTTYTDPVATSGFVYHGRIDVHEALIGGAAPNEFSWPAGELLPGAYTTVSGDIEDVAVGGADDHRLRLRSVATSFPLTPGQTLSAPFRVGVDWGGSLQLLIVRFEGQSTTTSPYTVSVKNEATGQWVSIGTVSFLSSPTDLLTELTQINHPEDYVNTDDVMRYVTVRISRTVPNIKGAPSPPPFDLLLDLLRVTAVSD